MMKFYWAVRLHYAHKRLTRATSALPKDFSERINEPGMIDKIIEFAMAFERHAHWLSKVSRAR